MGNKDNLLAGAKKCLIERGYGRTTARDIVAVSGANLASIGYHYGSKEALLNEALIECNNEWGAELERALRTDDIATIDPVERFEIIWTRIVELFSSHRQMWAANFEIFAQIERVPEVREVLAKSLQEACAGLGVTFTAHPGSQDEKSVRAVGYFYQALLNGLMAQWLIDPDNAPTGHDLALALRAIVADVQSGIVASSAAS